MFGLNSEKLVALQSENAELNFKVKMLELQLGTLKRRKEDFDKTIFEKFDRMKAIFLQLENEMCQLIIERQKVNVRLGHIYALISLFNSLIL